MAESALVGRTSECHTPAMLLPPSQVPQKFYVFVDQLRPVTSHNIKFVGSFSSGAWTTALSDPNFAQKYLADTVDYIPFAPNPSMDGGFLSPYHVSTITDYALEYNAELTRAAKFPDHPSRLSAIFAFGDHQSCVSVAQKHSWSLNEVEEFTLVSGPPFTRVAKVNMEIVSLMRLATRDSMMDANTIDGIWQHYWSGGGEVTMELPGADFKRHVVPSGEIWEYLIEGRLDRIGGTLGAPAQTSPTP
jgi:hypothetical protein